jgi:hypothetical protein
MYQRTMNRLAAFSILVGLGCLHLAFTTPVAQKGEVTYSDHIAPIVAEKCVSCHRPGGMGPFSLTTYDELKKRYALFRQVAMIRQMPPTDAISDVTHIATEAQLTDAETVLIQEWVRQGLKEGVPLAPPKPAPFAWRLGQPSKVVTAMSGVTVKAEGNAYRERQVLQLSLPEKAYLTAFDITPANPQSVRFARLGYRAAGSKEDVFPPLGALSKNLVASWAPGYFPWRLPAGTAYEIPAGAQLVLEVLYQPVGKPEKGTLDLALYLAGETPRLTSGMLRLGHDEFVLPKDEMMEMRASWVSDRDLDITAVYPEVRLLGRQIKLTAGVPGQPAKTLLLVYSYDPYWLGSYVFEKPVRIKKGTKLQLEVQYDNTKHSFGERDRETVEVGYGPRETDELFWLHVQYVPVSES